MQNALFRLLRSCFCALLLISLLPACSSLSYQQLPLDLNDLAAQLNSWNADDPGLQQFLAANGVAAEDLQGKRYSFRRLFLTGVYFDPELDAGFQQWQKQRIALAPAAQAVNPELELPVEHHSEKSASGSAWSLGAVLSFVYQRKGKREAQQAAQQVAVHKAELSLQRLLQQRLVQLRTDYIDYLQALAATKAIQQQTEILSELTERLQLKLQHGEISPFELSAAQLELQQKRYELALQKNQSEEARDALLMHTQLAYRHYAEIEIEAAMPQSLADQLYADAAWLKQDYKRLRSNMLTQHPQLMLALTDYAQAEAELRLEIENQYADIKLSPGFIFDQSDNIWTLGAAWILPIFKNSQQTVRIQQALQQRKIKQQEIVALQQQLSKQLYRRYRAARRYKEAMLANSAIIEIIETRSKRIAQQISLGEAEQTVLLRNQLALAMAYQQQSELSLAAVKAFYELENLLQNANAEIDIQQIFKHWLEHAKERSNDQSAL